MIIPWCVGGRDKSEEINQNVFGKVNPKTQKRVIIIRGTSSFCGRNESQIFTE